MQGVSIVILAKNEENNILDCLESVKEAGEIIVVDDYSEDRTLEIARKFGDKVKIFQHKLNGDFSAQRNFGLSKATCEWVLFVDADERVTEALASEISNLKSQIPNDTNGFYTKRRDAVWGRELKFGETGNIKLLRLGRKDSGKWKGKVHEVWNVSGKIGDLNNELIHYPHQTVREFLGEISLYSTIRANELYEKGVSVSAFHIVLYPKLKFLLNYFIKLGFMDGLSGLVLALMMSFQSFLVRGKLWLLNNKN